MVEGMLPFAKGASINMPPLFSGVYYPFSKIIMKNFIGSLDHGAWDAVVNGLYVSKTVIEGQIVDKPWSELSDSEINKVQFDCMAKNIITPALNL